VNPGSIDAQVKSSVVYGLTAALRGAITIDRGRVQQKNFNDYQVLRIDEMPIVDVHIIPSEEAPTGAGEFTLPPVAPSAVQRNFCGDGKPRAATADSAGRFAASVTRTFNSHQCVVSQYRSKSRCDTKKFCPTHL